MFSLAISSIWNCWRSSSRPMAAAISGSDCGKAPRNKWLEERASTAGWDECIKPLAQGKGGGPARLAVPGARLGATCQPPRDDHLQSTRSRLLTPVAYHKSRQWRASRGQQSMQPGSLAGKNGAPPVWSFNKGRPVGELTDKSFAARGNAEYYPAANVSVDTRKSPYQLCDRV